MLAPVEWLDWPAPASVKACFSLRRAAGQHEPNRFSSAVLSKAPFDQFNYALHVGDEPDVVMTNRQYLAKAIGQSHIQWKRSWFILGRRLVSVPLRSVMR